MSGHDDFAFEPEPGLPAPLPKGEHKLWQGRPDAGAMARECYKVNWITGYMLVLVVWRFAAGVADGGLMLGVAMAVPYLVLAALAYGVVYALAWAQARASIYTITSARVILRIGAALPVTYTIPFTRIATARVDVKPSGTGTIALETLGEDRLSYAVLWPHLRPGHARITQPALRCIRDAKAVADLLAEAAETRLNQPVISRAPALQGSAVAAE